MKKFTASLLVSALLFIMLFGTCVYPADIIQNTALEDTSVRSAAAHGDDVIITAGKDPSEYHFTWTAQSNGTEYLQWVQSDRVKDGVMPSECYTVTASKASSSCGYTVRATLQGAEPSVSYSYRVGSDAEGWSQIYSFDIPDYTDNSFSFVLAGDPQIGASSVWVDTEAWNTTISNMENWFGGNIDFLMTAGDQVNNHSTVEQYKGFADPTWLRSHMLITTVGNHDNGAGYSDHFSYSDVDSSTLSKAGNYGGDYWVEYEGCLIMSLNLNKDSVAAHSEFMRNAVAEYQNSYGEPYWTIVCFHQSIYSQGKRAVDAANFTRREELGPVFSELGVDAVLSGHDHVYTRAYMINGTTVIDEQSRYSYALGDPYGAYRNPEEGDVFYLTAGSSTGSKYYSLYTEVMPFSYAASEESIPAFTKIDVTKDSMTFSTYCSGVDNTAADIMDFFAIHRTGAEDDTPPTLNVPKRTVYSSEEELDLMAGVSAYDNKDGELTAQIKIEGTADSRGVTVITYTVTDKAGNTATAQRELVPVTETTLLKEGKVNWQYLDDGTTPFADGDKTSWTLEGFDDSAWKTGSGQFGAKNGAIAKIGSYTPTTLLTHYYPEGHENAGLTIPNYFFRTTFDLDTPETVVSLYGKVNYDDGCNIYINGVLISRVNTAKVVDNEGYCNKTSSNAQAYYINIKDKEFIDSLNLKEKGNVIAVQLFQSDNDSSDIFFRLKSLIVGNYKTDPYLNSSGVALTMHNIGNVKDIFIAEGDRATYREVKNNLVVQLTQNKLKGQNEYTYTVPRHGIHTVYIRYDDGSYLLLKQEITGAESEYTVNGLQLTVHNLENVKVIRTAYGEYSSVSALKRAATHRAFTAKNDIKGNDRYMIQYRENGTVTVAVCYNDGYTEFHTYMVEKKTPTMEQDGNIVKFGNLEGLYNIRYAKGEYTTSSEIKKVPGAVALKADKIDENGNITVTLASGTYTFCVQYDDESYNYFTVTVAE